MSMLENAVTLNDIWLDRRLNIPERFSSERETLFETVGLGIVELIKDFTKKYTVPLKFPLFQLHVQNRHYRAVMPITVYVYSDGEWFFAENETLVLSGSGASTEEAICDLERHIVHFWNYYRQLPDERLTGDAIRLKKIYSGLLIEDYTK